jgi:hypothetical protein
MMMLNVLKHVIFSGEASAATLVGASEGLTFFNVSMCCAVAVQVRSKVESSGAIGNIIVVTTTMLAIDMITAISFNICIKKLD